MKSYICSKELHFDALRPSKHLEGQNFGQIDEKVGRQVCRFCLRNEPIVDEDLAIELIVNFHRIFIT